MAVAGKYSFQTSVASINIPQRLDKIPEILRIKGSVNNVIDTVYLLIGGTHHKIIRVVSQGVHHFISTVDNHFAVSPRDSCRQKTTDFNIFFSCKPMRNLNRVTLNKIGSIV